MESSITETMKERAAERFNKRETIVTDIFPDLWGVEDFVFLGGASWTFTSANRRFLDPNYVQNLWGIPQTVGEVARDYLHAKYPKRLIRLKDQITLTARHRSPPLYCNPCAISDGVYIDLRGAYWSIVSRFGWDVDYYPEKWIGLNSSNMDYPLKSHKLARNILVSSALPASVNVWNYGRLETKDLGSRLINHGLWALTQDILHGVALDMIDAGAVYVHTDGYIIPPFLERRADEIIQEWGFTSSIKYRGDVTVYGVGRYQFPSSRELTGRERWSEPMYKVRNFDRTWLKRTVVRLGSGNST